MYFTRLIETWRIRDLGELLRISPCLVFYQLGPFGSRLSEGALDHFVVRAESLQVPLLRCDLETGSLEGVLGLFRSFGAEFAGLDVTRPLFLGVWSEDLSSGYATEVPAKVVYVEASDEPPEIPAWEDFGAEDRAVLEAFSEIYRWAREGDQESTSKSGSHVSREALERALEHVVASARAPRMAPRTAAMSAVFASDVLPDAQLTVAYAPLAGTVSFQLITSGDLSETAAEPSKRTLMRDPVKLLESYYDEIEGWRRGGLRAQHAERLRSVGWGLSQQLLPESIARHLRRLSRRSGDEPPCLCVVSDELLFPWEILCLPAENGDPGPFLAEAFALTRWTYPYRPVSEMSLARAALVVPETPDLPAVPTELERLCSWDSEGRWSSELVTGSGPFKALIASGRFDVLHFSGHAATWGSNPNLWHIRLADRELDSLDLQHLGSPLRERRPLVFLNACQSSRGAPALSRIEGLARCFLDLGAGAFVGTYWEVGDRAAAEFADHLYTQLFEGRRFGDAFRRARLATREVTPGDPSWLAYTAIAHPLAVFARRS